MNAPFFPIETPRLRIEAYRAGDVPVAHRILSDAETMRSWPFPFTVERTQAWIAAAVRSYGETGVGRGMVVLKETGETIGDAGIQRFGLGADTAYDLGVIIAAHHQGRGLATELTRALVSAAFGRLRLTEIRASIALADVASRRMFERSGFRLVRLYSDHASDGFSSAIFAAHAQTSRVVPRIKMCGMTSPYDAELAVAAGADAVGMIFAESERRITLEMAREIVRTLPALTDRVAVFVDAPGDDVRRICEELGAIPQFSGSESVDYCERYGGEKCIRVVRVGDLAETTDLLRDTSDGARIMTFFEPYVPGASGGTGRRFDWDLVASVAKIHPIGVSGGLTPDNVAECVRVARPFAVDVRSGVESKGRKDFERMQSFVAAALATRSGAAAYA